MEIIYVLCDFLSSNLTISFSGLMLNKFIEYIESLWFFSGTGKESTSI